MKKFQNYLIVLLLVACNPFIYLHANRRIPPKQQPTVQTPQQTPPSGTPEFPQTKGAFLITNDQLHSGFGAEFSAVLGSLNYYESGNYAGLKIDYNTGMYLDPSPSGSNWWEYFFEPIVLGDENHPEKHNFTFLETVKLSQTGYGLSRQRCYELIQKYIRVKPAILEEIDAFYKMHFSGYYVIGVHHRGTDKALDGPLVSFEKTVQSIFNLIRNLPSSDQSRVKIYVATDDQKFLDFMLRYFSKNLIYNNFVRSTNDRPIHYDCPLFENNYQKGKEAVIDCLLLSKCQALVRPAPSGFSWVSMMFNPYMPVTLMFGG